MPSARGGVQTHLSPYLDEELLYNKEKLLEIYDQTKDNPKDPVRTGRGRLGPASEFDELPALGPATSVVRNDRAAAASTPGVIGPPPPEPGKR